MLKEDLDWLRKNWTPDDPTFRHWIAGSDRAIDLIDLLIEQALHICDPECGETQHCPYEGEGSSTS